MGEGSADSDALRLTILWHPSLSSGPALAEAMAETFDRVGMIRDNVQLGIPIRIRTAPVESPDTPPRPIDWHKAETNGVIIFSNAGMVRAMRRGWRPFIDAIRQKRREADANIFVIVIATDVAGNGFTLDPEDHVERKFIGRLNQPSEHVLRRLQIRLLAAVGQHFKVACPGSDPTRPSAPETVFISHASADGRDIAEWIDTYVRTADLGVSTFIDSKSIPAGMNFRKIFEDAISRCAFLAVQTDAWGSRPYCQWELLHAKRHRRPIIAVNRIRNGEDRVFPYAGNVARRCVRLEDAGGGRTRWLSSWRAGRGRPPLEAGETEQIIKDVCSEVLRCLVWQRTAERMLHRLDCHDALILPRPPELADLALVRGTHDEAAKLLVYPDPPIGSIEKELLDALRGSVEIRSLSEVAELMA